MVKNILVKIPSYVLIALAWNWEKWSKCYPKGEKIVPRSLARQLNLVSLATWIADDGAHRKSGMYIHTINSFSYEDTNMLASVLKKLKIYCNVVILNIIQWSTSKSNLKNNRVHFFIKHNRM